jgi:hypothetical protein
MCCFVRLGFFCLCGGEKKQNKLPSICTDLFTKHQINKFFFLLINLLFQSIEFCLFTLAYNVRRYVALPQSRGGARFCTRDAMQGYDVICLFSRWQKP